MYLRLYLMIVVVGLGLIAAINFAVDPYATFRWGDIKGFNDQKNFKRDGGRANKSLVLAQYPFQVLFFGSSTTETGLNPASAVLEGKSAFNASLPFTSISELNQVALFAAKHQTPEFVVIGLDLLNFAAGGKVNGDFNASLFAGADPLPLKVKRLLYKQALEDSFGIVSASRKHIPSMYPKTGHHNPAGGKRSNVDYRDEFVRTLDSFVRPGVYGDFLYDPENITRLSQVVSAFTAKGTRVILFVQPYHILQKSLMAQMDVLPAFGQWKCDLVQMVAASSPAVELWDFSATSAITTEELPPSTGEHMKNYWDCNHYTEAVGDLILARILERPAAPTDFGVRLTSNNIDDVVAQDKAIEPPAIFHDDVQRLHDIIAHRNDK